MFFGIEEVSTFQVAISLFVAGINAADISGKSYSSTIKIF